MPSRIGLVLMSGGARGAYQAGVLRALAELTGRGPCPFPVLTGISAGSVNVTFVGSRADDFVSATEELTHLWAQLTFERVFDSRALGLAARGARWMADLSLGGWIGTGRGKSLLDPTPLRQRLSEWLRLEDLRAHLRAGRLYAVGITATHYRSGTTVTFFEGPEEVEPWQRVTRIGVRAHLTLEHVLASGAIPVFFPAIKVNGGYYGDGAIRMTAPVSPALHLGADRVLVVAIHAREPWVHHPSMTPEFHYPSMAEMGGVLLNSLFLRTLDGDVERLRRINQTLALIPPEVARAHPHRLRRIPVLVLRPSHDLGRLVQDVIGRFPYSVRHLLRGLGASRTMGWELLSYLAFESGYTQPLMELGYEDTLARREEIQTFFEMEQLPRQETDVPLAPPS